jgi:pilus assembly protein CpaB
MNSRFMTMLIIALVLAGGAALIAKRWVDSFRNTPESAAQNTVPVYVAAVNIPYTTRLEQTHYKLVNWPKENVPAEAFTEADTKADPNVMVGKVAQRDFFAGEILLKPQIKEHLGGSTLSALIQEGMRAISVRVDDVVGVAGFILPGNKADIITSEGHKGETFTLLRNVKILAIDQTASPDQDKPAVVRALTLEVTPKQAEVLVHAMKNGSLQFTLRNPMDTTAPPAEIVQPVSDSPEATPKKPPLSVNILPWSSQKFTKCQEEESC